GRQQRPWHRLKYNGFPFRRDSFESPAKPEAHITRLSRALFMSTTTSSMQSSAQPTNSKSRVLFASLIGTTIEFYDFYVYATAAVLVFPHLFFPPGNDTTALLASFAIFGAAMIARPLGAVFFGHMGDKVGRKTTLVAALLTMGVATFLI